MHIARTNRVLGALALASALLVSACTSGDAASDTEADPTAHEGHASAHDMAGSALPAPPPDAPPATGTPGLTEVAPGRFVAVIYAWDGGFVPNEVRVPVGAEVTFRLASRDQGHGFLIEGTPVEMDVFPGVVTEQTHTFPVAGEYLVMCHIYCGAGHFEMQAKVIVGAAAED